MQRLFGSVCRGGVRSLAYKARLRDLQFLLNEVHDYPGHYNKLGATDATPDVVENIITEAAKFSETALAPLYQTSDQGCVFKDGEVTTPPGFKEAYKQYAEGGWQSLSMPTAYGGQGLPASLALARTELVATANWTFSMYPGLSMGAMETILLHGTEDLKQTYLPNMTSGVWTGVMDLTESQAGTDLNQVKTKAIPQEDGTFRITGEKIFISCGEHDIAENIIHIVLARLPDAPPGTRGISLFLVPKYIVKADGTLDTSKKNCVASSIEHKMGIKGSSTCVIVFNESVGYLIGQPNKGLKHMFTFMNLARLGTSIQGIGTMELALQNSVPYARERMSMRALSGAKEKDKPGDRIIHHPDVRRMLLTQKAFAEGGRSLLYHVGKLGDKFLAAESEKEKNRYEDEMGLYTPILKGFLTEVSQEAAYYGVQVYGGHGFIKEWGMEQIARDARISTLYEGTTGVQALDLIGRKILTSKPPMKLLMGYIKEILGFCAQNATNPALAPLVVPLARHTLKWVYLTTRVLVQAARDREVVGSASVDYLMFAGYVTLAHQWAVMAAVAHKKLPEAKGDDIEFYKAKLQTAEFYFKCILPRVHTHAKVMLVNSKSKMQIKEEWICPSQ
jgi:alkylation response protein AidB-like acyl-CoA dehydrogenase